MKFYTLLATFATTAVSLNAAVLNFSGFSDNDNLTAIPWVIAPGPTQTYMWGDITTGSGTGTANSGFTSIADPTLLTFSFGDLELDVANSQSPGVGTPGWEEYRELSAPVVNMDFFYNGALWATGQLVDAYRIDVADVDDFAGGIGTAQIELISNTAAGLAFFNEVDALTGGTRILDFENGNFVVVSGPDGTFTSTGSFTAIPEPSSFAMVCLGAVFLFTAVRRRRA